MMRFFRAYALLFVIAVVLFEIFIFLEKNNKTLTWQLHNKKQLNPQSISILKSLGADKAIKFEVFTSPKSMVAKKIAAFFKPYKHVNKAINVTFIDPSTQPNLIKQYGITMQGEIIASFQNNALKHVSITELSETALINAILQLQRKDDKWLVFAQGYGMRTIEDNSPSGLSDLLIYLKKSGVHIARLNLSPLLELPENVKVLVLPAPTKTLDGKIVAWLQNQIDKGISLWWLADIDSPQQQHLELVTNTMLAAKVPLVGDKFVAALNNFGHSKITENFNQPVLFAQSKEIITADANTILSTELGKTIAVAKQLPHARLFITGDVDFISNHYLNVAANKNFILRIIDWLFYHDDRINIALHRNENTQLFLSQNQLIALSVVFLLLFPLFYLVLAVLNYRRRNAS